MSYDFAYFFTIGKQESIIRNISERITFLSIDIHTRTFLIANDIVWTFFLSSQTNSISPRFLSKNSSKSVFMAICENWCWVFFASKSGVSSGLLLYAKSSPPFPIMPTNLINGLIPDISSQIFTYSFFIIWFVVKRWYFNDCGIFCKQLPSSLLINNAYLMIDLWILQQFFHLLLKSGILVWY